MNLGILLPGFSADAADWAIPVQRDLLRHLSKDNNVRVLALRYPDARPVYSLEGAQIHALGAGQTRGFGRLALWARAILLLERQHRQQPFDLLHAMWADETGLVAVAAARRLGIPAVVSLSGGELVGFSDIGYGLQRGAFSRWIVRRALQGAAAVVAPCAYTARLIAASGAKVPAHRIHHIPLGVDLQRFTVTAAQAEVDLLSAGSLIGVKNHIVLLQALALLPRATSLRIIGAGPEQPLLQQVTADLGLTAQVTFAGPLPYLDMPAAFASARLHILPSRHEGFGMVTVEAAACGLPTIGSAVGVLAQEPDFGVTVPVSDPAALAAAILPLLRDSAARDTHARRARHRAESSYRIEQSAAALQTLYHALLIPR